MLEASLYAQPALYQAMVGIESEYKRLVDDKDEMRRRSSSAVLVTRAGRSAHARRFQVTEGNSSWEPLTRGTGRRSE